MSEPARHLLCLACRHSWQAPLPTQQRIAAWIAAVQALRCPQCGARIRHIAVHPEAAP